MRIIKHNEEWSLVEVPKGSSDFAVLTGRILPVLAYTTDHPHMKGVEVDEFINLPPGFTYTPIGLAPTLSEEQAGEVVGVRIIHKITGELKPIFSDTQCCYSGCSSLADRKHFALLYEGEYTDDMDLGAGMPICSFHAMDALEALEFICEYLRLPFENCLIVKTEKK